MLKHHTEVLNAGERPLPARRVGARRFAAASLFLVAWLSFFAFVGLYRAPLPAEAFTALAVQLADKADMAHTA